VAFSEREEHAQQLEKVRGSLDESRSRVADAHFEEAVVTLGDS
jgi:hypothetical protein